MKETEGLKLPYFNLYLWACEDPCHCCQPKLVFVKPHPIEKGAVLNQAVWCGTFASEPSPDEMQALVDELAAKAEEFGIHLDPETDRGTLQLSDEDDQSGLRNRLFVQHLDRTRSKREMRAQLEAAAAGKYSCPLEKCWCRDERTA